MISVWLWLSTLVVTVQGVWGFIFELQPGSLSKCGRVNVVWQGGVPPFHMVIVPAFDYPSNISLPNSAWSQETQRGNFSWTVNYPAGTKLVAMMSDSTGEGSGGVSPLYTVADSAANCQMRPTATDFLFYLNSTNVNQCSSLQVYWDSTAVAPVRMLGVIPSGQPFMYTASPGSTTWNWNTNIAAGTSFILGAFDGGRTGIGGSSDIMTVGAGSAGCLDESSPSSTPVVAVPTQTTSGGGRDTGSPTGSGLGQGGVKTVTAIATVMPEGSGKGLNTGAIAGIVISSILALLALQAAIFWFCCRRQISDLLSHRKDMRTKGIKNGQVDLASEHQSPMEPLGTRGSGLGAFGLGRGRNDRSPRYGGEGDEEAESTISPFHDDRRISRPDLLAGRVERDHAPGYGDSAFDSDSMLAPPRLHGRNGSVDSGLTLDLPMSTFDPFNVSPTDSPPLSSANTPPASRSTTQLLPTSHPPRAPTKAQIAASLSLQNTTDDERSRIGTGYRGPIMPSQSAPAGGLVRHEDAGPASRDVEDLPPLYRPEWEAESLRRR